MSMAAEAGKADREISYDAIKDLCRQLEEPVITTTDVKDYFDVSQQAAYYRLSKLVDRGEMTRKKIGANANIWWIVDD